MANIPSDYETDLFLKIIRPTQMSMKKNIKEGFHVIGQTVSISIVIRDSDPICLELWTTNGGLGDRIKTLCDTAEYKFDYMMEYHPRTSGVKITYSHIVTEKDLANAQ